MCQALCTLGQVLFTFGQRSQSPPHLPLGLGSSRLTLGQRRATHLSRMLRTLGCTSRLLCVSQLGASCCQLGRRLLALCSGGSLLPCHLPSARLQALCCLLQRGAFSCQGFAFTLQRPLQLCQLITLAPQPRLQLCCAALRRLPRLASRGALL